MRALRGIQPLYHMTFSYENYNFMGPNILIQAIENALTPFGFKITGTNLDLGLRDLLFEADEFEIPVRTEPD